MERTTLCYIRRGGMYLLLHRVGREGDINGGKWLGVGGHFEGDETPEQCIRREIKEETGLDAVTADFRGIVFFDSDAYPPEEMYLFVCDEFSGTLTDHCDEGELAWVPRDRLTELPMWEGDRIFLNMIARGERNFRLHLTYSGDSLKSYSSEPLGCV